MKTFLFCSPWWKIQSINILLFEKWIIHPQFVCSCQNHFVHFWASCFSDSRLKLLTFWSWTGTEPWRVFSSNMLGPCAGFGPWHLLRLQARCRAACWTGCPLQSQVPLQVPASLLVNNYPCEVWDANVQRRRGNRKVNWKSAGSCSDVPPEGIFYLSMESHTQKTFSLSAWLMVIKVIRFVKLLVFLHSVKQRAQHFLHQTESGG